MTLTFHALWMLCALGAVVLATAARRVRDRVGLVVGGVAAAAYWSGDRLPDAAIIGLLTAAAAAAGLMATPNSQGPTPNFQLPTSNSQPPTPKHKRAGTKLGVGNWPLGVGNWELGVGSWQLGVGHRQLAVESWQLGVSLAGGGLTGILTALLEVQGMPPALAPVPVAALVLVTWLLTSRRPAFAPDVLREEGLLAVGVLGLGVAVLPGALDGWHAAANLSAAATERGSATQVPAWTLALLLISSCGGAVYSSWSRR